MGMLKLADPRFGPEALEAIAEVLSSGRLSDGPKVAAFERAIANYCDVAYAIATTSATTALELVLAALDIGRGHEVVVADFTYPATANAAVQRGATVKLADIDLSTYCVDPDAVERAISDRTAAIITVDVFGLPADYSRLGRIAREREIPLICDAACSLGARDGDLKVGAIGTAACFSFHPRKSLTTGEGGMVTTNDPGLAERMRRLRNHGSVREGWRSVFVEPGFNYRLSEIQAALGLVQVPHIDAVVAKRNALAQKLSAELSGVEGVVSQRIPSGAVHAYQAYVTLLDEGIDRDAMVVALRAQEIEATLGTYALHAEPAFGSLCSMDPGDLPNSWAAVSRTLALPLHQGLELDDMRRVAESVAQAIATCRAPGSPR